MEQHEQLRLAATKLFSFVDQPHEGLGPDEQAALKTHCRIIDNIANEIEERSNDGKA